MARAVAYFGVFQYGTHIKGFLVRIIGIDPDLTASGVALVEGNKIIMLDKVSLPELLVWVNKNRWIANGEIIIRMEDPNLIKPTFPRAMPKARNKQAVMNNISQKVGQVKAVATIIMQLLEHAGHQVKPVRPLQGAMKHLAKRDAKYFNQITGWDGRSNEDQRDAALIALFGG